MSLTKCCVDVRCSAELLICLLLYHLMSCIVQFDAWTNYALHVELCWIHSTHLQCYLYVVATFSVLPKVIPSLSLHKNSVCVRSLQARFWLRLNFVHHAKHYLIEMNLILYSYCEKKLLFLRSLSDELTSSMQQFRVRHGWLHDTRIFLTKINGLSCSETAWVFEVILGQRENTEIRVLYSVKLMQGSSIQHPRPEHMDCASFDQSPSSDRPSSTAKLFTSSNFIWPIYIDSILSFNTRPDSLAQKFWLTSMADLPCKYHLEHVPFLDHLT
jgi:hypothetical protein